MCDVTQLFFKLARPTLGKLFPSLSTFLRMAMLLLLAQAEII